MQENTTGQEIEGIQLIRRGRAVIKKDSRMLMCQRVGTDYWYLPGGKLDLGEDARLGLIREIREETGCEGCTDKLIGVYEHVYRDVRRGRVHEINFVFSFDFPGSLPKIVESKEIHLRFAWIDIEGLRELRDVVTPPRFLPANLFPLIFAVGKDPIHNMGFYAVESEFKTDGPDYRTLRSRYEVAVGELLSD